MISVIVFIHKLRTKELLVQTEAIEWLEELDEKLKITVSDEDSIFRGWLEKSNKPIYDEHKKCREQLTKFLYQYGFNTIVSDKVSKQINFQLSDYEDQKAVQNSFFKTQFENWQKSLLEKTIDSIEYSIVTYIDTTVLKTKIDSTINILIQRGELRKDYDQKIQGVHYSQEENELSLFIAVTTYGQKAAEILPLAVTAKKLKAPSHAAMLNLTESNEDWQMHKVITLINKRFAKVKKDEVKRIISDEYARTYAEVSIFGFDFSVTLFPYFIGFILILLASLLFSITKNKNVNNSLFGTNLTDELMEPFINNPLSRFVVWLILPAVTISFVVYDYTHVGSIVMMLILALTCTILLGFLSFRHTIRK